jgi:D-amino-acid dehydrogenase
MQRVVVIGGGVVGASAAYQLARAGVDTVLVDRGDAGHATAAGAGIISPGTSTRPLPAFFPFAQAAVGWYPALIGSLAEDGETDTRYEAVGELILARTGDEAAALPGLKALFAERRAGGMPNLGNVIDVDAATAREMFPALGDVQAALHVPEAARVDGDCLRKALVAGARHHGATIRNGNVSLGVARDRVTGVVVDGEALDVDGVVIATGAWTNQVLAPLGVSVAVEPQRGQILHLTLGDTDTTRWPILGGTGSQYILTFGPNRVVSGATRETGSGFDVRLTVGGLQSVFNHAMEVAPGLAGGTVSEIRIGLRPLSADGLPFLGKMPGHDNVVLATGHGPSGLQLGPYSGLVAARLVTGQAVDVDLTPFAVDRDVTDHEYAGH